jgi:hypothetical protein
MLVCVPEPGHTEQVDDPGRDEYPAWQGVMTELAQLLPCKQTEHDESVSWSMYFPFSHRPWQFPSLSCRESEGQMQSYTELVPVVTVDGIMALCSNVIWTDQNLGAGKVLP